MEPPVEYNIIMIWEKYHWVIIAVALIMIGLYVAFLLIWRYMKKSAQKETDDMCMTFSLPQLCDMLKQGLINKEEYEKLRQMIGDEPHAGTKKTE